MTLPPSLSELDAETETDQQLSRVSVLVGGLLVDVGLPTDLSIATVIGEVIELASDQLPVHTELLDVAFDNTEGKWTFARLGGETIDPQRSLGEAGVYDGEVLQVRQVGAPAAPVLFDDVETAPTPSPRARWWADNRWRAGWFALSITAAVAVAVMLARQPVGPPLAAAAALLTGACCAVLACTLPLRFGDARTSAWLAGVALPLIFGASLHIVPGGHGVTALPMALALTALVALLVLLITGRGRSLYTGVIAVAALAVPAAVVHLLFNPNPRGVGAITATVAVIVVYLAPRVTIMLSKLPVPRVPTAGEPLDDIEMQGGPTVEGVSAVGKQVIPTDEGMADRVRTANEYLTGIIAAAALVALVGCYLAVDVTAGFYWQGTLFVIVVATVLCLRGRSHHDLIQSATLIGAGVAVAVALIVKTATHVEGWRAGSALALVALTMLLVVCGLVAPRQEFSPVMRRWVEIGEYVAIGLIFPLACWIVGLYAFFRELRI